jgi:hypothetical protein
MPQSTQQTLRIHRSTFDDIINRTNINPLALQAVWLNESERAPRVVNDRAQVSTPADIQQINRANVRYEGHRLFQGSTEQSSIPGYSKRFGYLNQQFDKQKIPMARRVEIVNALRQKYPLAFSTSMSTAEILQGKAPSTADITNKNFHGLEALRQGQAMVAELNTTYGIAIDPRVTYAITSTGVTQLLGDEIKGTSASGEITLADMQAHYRSETGDQLNTQSITDYLNKPASQRAFANKPTTVVIPISATEGIEVTLPFDPKAVAEYHNGKANANNRFLSPTAINMGNGNSIKPTGIKLTYPERLAINAINASRDNGQPLETKRVKLTAAQRQEVRRPAGIRR